MRSWDTGFRHCEFPAVKKLWKGHFFFFCFWHRCFTLFIKTPPATHLIGWLARRLKPCRIKFIYLPQKKTHLGRRTERGGSDARLCRFIFSLALSRSFFSFFFKKAQSPHAATSVRPSVACLFMFSVPNEEESPDASIECVYACPPARPPARCCSRGGRAPLLMRFTQSFPLTDNPTGTLPRGQFAQSCAFQAWSVRLQAKLHCDWLKMECLKFVAVGTGCVWLIELYNTLKMYSGAFFAQLASLLCPPIFVSIHPPKKKSHSGLRLQAEIFLSV